MSTFQQPALEQTVDRVADLLVESSRILFITGAGISADSGLPTYRGIGGLYEDVDTDDGIPIDVALSGSMMSQRPDVTWRYIRQIEEACRGASFNGGHVALAELERLRPESWVLTQNVDGFHRAAGTRQLMEIHGNLRRLFCLRCDWTTEVRDYADLDPLPACPHCSAVVRPAVVLFGEALPSAVVDVLYRELMRGFDLVFSIGTSSLFPYIAEPVVRAARAGVPTVEVNPAPTDLSQLVDHRLRCGATEALEAIRDAFVPRVQP